MTEGNRSYERLIDITWIGNKKTYQLEFGLCNYYQSNQF